MRLNVAQHRGLNAAVGEIEARMLVVLWSPLAPVAMLDLRWRKLERARVAKRREPVDNRPAGIAQAEQLGDFIEGFAGSIVTGMSDIPVRPALCLLFRKVKMRVAARHH